MKLVGIFIDSWIEAKIEKECILLERRGANLAFFYPLFQELKGNETLPAQIISALSLVVIEGNLPPITIFIDMIFKSSGQTLCIFGRENG